MKIDHEFTVSVPVQRAWEVLTDLEGVAPCMPGAQLTGVEDEVYSGKVRIKVGPVVSDYAGTARFVEKDDAAYHAVISARGKDSKGTGSANATINAQLRPDGERTVVTVNTDLAISGKVAQFGAGMIKEVSEKLLGQFVANLEAQLLVPAAVLPEPAAETAETAETAEPGEAAGASTKRVINEGVEIEPLDLLSVAGSSAYKRLVPLAVGLVVIIAVIVYLVVR